MIKLFTLKDISSFSSDAIYKVCLALDEQGFSEENIESFKSYDEIFSAAVSAVDKGDHIIIAVEPGDYISAKKELISTLILELSSSAEIAQAISVHAHDDISEIDMEGHCIIPEAAQCHLTTDGLYSGFTTEMLSGKLTYIPLDFGRIDPVLLSLADSLKKKEPQVQQPEQEAQSYGYDFTPAVRGLVDTLSKTNKRVALATGEATMWVYNLYSTIDNLTQTVSFVEVIDPKTEDAEAENTDAAEETENQQEVEKQEAAGEYVPGQAPTPVPQPSDEASRENESMRIIRHAREAMYNTDCDFGAAVSEVYSSENANGQTVYFAYVAVVDRSTARAKKINTANADDLPLILPHAITILSDVVCEKAESMNTAIARVDYTEPEEEEEKPKAKEKKNQITISKGMMIFACIVLVFSLLSPMVMTYLILRPQSVNATTTAPSTSGYVTEATTVATTASSTVTTTDFFNSTTLPDVTESTAPDVSAQTTTAPAPSESGTFTFYVFGYGHGVGMSQVGANYFASIGWTAEEILAHYYYNENAKIVTGDTYPATITYSGTSYDTREYLASALESEMGSSFNYQALKAQAIALYTFAKYNNYNCDADAHSFGKTPSSTVYTVVDEVMKDGYYISYAGDVALTPFHAMSAGVTTSYYNVWGKSVGATVPYLSGGRKSYGDYLDSEFKSTYTISSDDLKELVKSTAGITLAGDPSTWISIISHDSAVRDDIGYVSSINVGGTIMTGNNFRINVMQGRIRSHCFALVYTPDA